MVYFTAIFCCFSDEEETAEYWLKLGREELMAAINLQQLNMNVARNVIIFLGKFWKRYTQSESSSAASER